MKKEKIQIDNIVYYGYKHHKYDQMVMNGLYNRSNVSIGYQSNDIKKGFWLDKLGKTKVDLLILCIDLIHRINNVYVNELPLLYQTINIDGNNYIVEDIDHGLNGVLLIVSI